MCERETGADVTRQGLQASDRSGQDAPSTWVRFMARPRLLHFASGRFTVVARSPGKATAEASCQSARPSRPPVAVHVTMWQQHFGFDILPCLPLP